MGAGSSVVADSPTPAITSPVTDPESPLQGRDLFLFRPGDSRKLERDPCLTVKGTREAQALGKILQQASFLQVQRIGTIFCSPLRRSLQTAVLLFPNPKTRLLVLPALSEIRQSIADAGHVFSRLEAEFGDHPQLDFQFARVEPDAHWWPSNDSMLYKESRADATPRLRQFEELLKDRLLRAGNVVAVGHSRYWDEFLRLIALPTWRGGSEGNTGGSAMPSIGGCGVLALRYYPLTQSFEPSPVVLSAAESKEEEQTEPSDDEDDESTTALISPKTRSEASHMGPPSICRATWQMSIDGSSAAVHSAFFIRHGQSRNNALGLWNSWRWVRDPLLSPLGILQAEQLGIELKEHGFVSAHNIAAVYTSPLRRAIQTACLIFKHNEIPGGNIIVNPVFSEIRSSISDKGHSFAELQHDRHIAPLLPKLDVSTFAPADPAGRWWFSGKTAKVVGETEDDWSHRLDCFDRWLRQELQGKHVVLVGHSHFWQQYEARVTKNPDAKKLGNCGVLQLLYNTATQQFEKQHNILLSGCGDDED
eukprot:TRINITY_DN41520_c0_g1_i1.p1 TRINITY_DN41520_c0_g1~~TRINITY_DN41520_c0_g1_i1.p1  ORF type:complete len:534 (-),score=79.83 TRINITY_DN41520_c0_g1_i1:30-1631(-)